MRANHLGSLAMYTKHDQVLCYVTTGASTSKWFGLVSMHFMAVMLIYRNLKQNKVQPTVYWCYRILPSLDYLTFTDACTPTAAQTQTVLASTVHLYPHLDEDTLVCREQSRNAAKLDRRGSLKSQE